MLRSTSRVLAFSLLLAATPRAGAQTETGLPVSVHLLEMVNLPAESPRMTLKADDRVELLNLVLREQGRVVLQRSLGSLAAGSERAIVWRAEPGEHKYEVQVSGKSTTGSARVSVDAVVTVMRPLDVKLVRNQVDVEARTLFFSMNNPASHTRLSIQNAAGRVVYDGTTDLSGRPAGSKLVITWPDPGEPISRMQLRVYDASDSWSDFELVPFTIEIPHDDVVFETAKWDVLPAEQPKLDVAYDAILDAIREHGSDLQARLYILGHTDTVGSAADNLTLSRHRADAIARYFLARGGISLPILAQGFGESQLKKATADNVDEPRNRRAQYILAAQSPAQTDWTVVSAGKAAAPER